jgi:hypothetical protein
MFNMGGVQNPFQNVQMNSMNAGAGIGGANLNAIYENLNYYKNLVKNIQTE